MLSYMPSVKDKLIAMETLERAAAMLRVLAHPHRLRICEILMRERVPVNMIAEHLGIPPNAASQHLNIMRAHGLLTAERDGKTVYYHVADARAGWVLECIRNHHPGK
jgi:ArsR family transcriptional regulator, zinc-responsive transcriptional repressor